MALTAQDRNIYKGLHPQLKKAQEKIKITTGHKHVRVVNSGNAAIMIVLNSIKGPILVPDQGSWSGVLKIADFLSKDLIKVETDKGLLSVDLLKESLDNISKKPQALFISSLAAYTAEQPILELADFCKDQEILLVEDASGAIGDPEKKLGNGRQSNIILASTGSPKLVNVGSGGFISTDKQEIFDKSSLLIRSLRTSPIIAAGIAQELEFAGDNYKKLSQATSYLKNQIREVIHQNKRGTNLILPCSDPPRRARELRNSLQVEGKNIITICPFYDRIEERAVCVEIKNLDPDCLNKKNLREISAVITDIMF